MFMYVRERVQGEKAVCGSAYFNVTWHWCDCVGCSVTAASPKPGESLSASNLSREACREMLPEVSSQAFTKATLVQAFLHPVCLRNCTLMLGLSYFSQ